MLGCPHWPDVLTPDASCLQVDHARHRPRHRRRRRHRHWRWRWVSWRSTVPEPCSRPFDPAGGIWRPILVEKKARRRVWSCMPHRLTVRRCIMPGTLRPRIWVLLGFPALVFVRIMPRRVSEWAVPSNAPHDTQANTDRRIATLPVDRQLRAATT